MTYEPNSNQQAHEEMRESRRTANIAVWIPIGTGAGVALGLVLGNLALGIAIGAGLGVVIGAAVNVSRASAEMEDAGSPGRRWIYVVAVIGGLLLLSATILFVELLNR